MLFMLQVQVRSLVLSEAPRMGLSVEAGTLPGAELNGAGWEALVCHFSALPDLVSFISFLHFHFFTCKIWITRLFVH